MKCTDCTNYLRPIVSVDIDGTLADYHSHFQWFAEMFTGRFLATHAKFSDEVFDYTEEFSDYLGMPKEEYRRAKLAYRQGGMKRCMPLERDARWVMNKIRDLDTEIWISTSRPWESLDNIDRDTKEWLRRNGIPYDYLIFGEDKYSQLAERVDHGRVVAIVDDLPGQVIRARTIGFPVIHYTARCLTYSVSNRIKRCSNHLLVFQEIEERIASWRQQTVSSETS